MSEEVKSKIELSVVEPVEKSAGFGEGPLGGEAEAKENVSNTVTEAPAKTAPEKPKPSPAQELRNIQALIVGGIFPGNVAPQIVQAYKLLEDMAVNIEKADAPVQAS